MNLFERIQYRLNEEPTDNKGQNKKSSRNKKKFSDNISNKVKVSTDVEGLGDRQGRQDATNPKKGGYSRVEDSLDNKPSGKTKLGNTTQGGPVKTFFDKDKAKAKREKLLQGRQDYIDPKTNKASKEGIKRYISKARNMASGTNANNKANQKAAEVISKSAGKEYASKINKKYGGTLAKTRKVSDSTFKRIQQKINIKSPVRTSPVSGQLIPLKGKELRDYKLQQQQQQQAQSGSTTTTTTTRKPRVIKKTNIKGDPLKVNTKELEKIKPKVTTSKTAFVQPPAKKKILTQTQKLSQKLMKNKNKYAKIAGVTLATGAAILGTNRVMQAQKKQKKAIAALAKDNPKNYTPVDVDLFLNKSGTSPSPSKFITPKITTPKNNPKSKYTSGVSNAAKNNATLSYDPNKIASYAKPSISSKDIKPPKPISKKERNKINQQVNKYVSDRK